MALTGLPVAVIGAGVAGLAAALALARRGAAVTVLERAEAIRAFGAGLQISPNGAAVIRALGLGPALDAAGDAAQAVQLFDGPTGRPVLRLPLDGRGFRLIHRADLIALLAAGARAAGVDIRTGQDVAAVDLAGDRPVLQTVAGDRHAAALVVGADGLHSVLRAALNGTVAPFFTQQVAWRATLPDAPGAPAVAEVHMGPGRHLVSYPLRGGRLRNVVAVEERYRWAEEGWSLPDDPDALRQAFRGFGPRVQGWLDAVEHVHLWGLFRHPVARRWHQGRAVILGDAAHPTLPFLAQGANMALEDAWVLGACLDAAGPVETALAAFRTARAARCARIVAASGANARVYHLRKPWRGMAHLALRSAAALAPDLTARQALSRLDWLYRHDVTV
jgi:salicylate hydroxylase